MVNRIRDYVDELFTNTPKINKATELHDELLANLIEKYNDLLLKGMGEEEAYRTVIDGIGDMDELLGDIKIQTNRMEFEYMQEHRRRYALLLAVSIASFIVSFVFPILMQNALGAALMFLSWGFGVGLIIYNSMTKPKYNMKDDTMVEDFKQWNHQKNHSKTLEKAIFEALDIVVVAIYLIYSIKTRSWVYSWIIFVIYGAVRNIIKELFRANRR